jgi:hypothetical protein
MAGITLAQAEAKLSEYLAAETAVLGGQSVRHESGRMLTYADLATIREGIAHWDSQVKILTSSATRGGRSRVVAPGW